MHIIVNSTSGLHLASIHQMAPPRPR